MSVPRAVMVTLLAVVSFAAAVIEGLVEPSAANNAITGGGTVTAVALAAIGLTLAVVKLVPIFLKNKESIGTTIGTMSLPAFREEIRSLIKDGLQPFEGELKENTQAIRENTHEMNDHKNAITMLVELEKADRERGGRRR